jgi:Zn-dependent peptidase ImmA (M78 family)
MKKNTLLSVARIEVEANTFAAELLIPDDSLTGCHHLTIYEIASLHNVPTEIAMLKCKGLF